MKYRKALSFLAALFTASAGLNLVAPAPVSSAPALVITAEEAPAGALFGDTASYTFEACNPGGPDGFNLSFRAVIGENGILGSGGDAPSLVVNNEPSPGETTVIWENVSDIPVGACGTITFNVDHVTTSMTFDVGSSYTVDVGAYTNILPRDVPDFNTDGTPIPTSYTGSGTAPQHDTQIKALDVTKGEPGEEAELLRGVHNHQTVYTINVQNNFVNPTDGVKVVDLIPAGMEFLGCGGDNTLDAPTNPNPPLIPTDEEYLGAGILNAPGALAGCTAPDVVETVDIAGSIFTRVEWNNGGLLYDMADSDLLTLRYLAGIPIRANTMMWTGPTPATTGAQGANLDNNSGDETAETASESLMENTVTADGIYNRNDATTQPESDDGLERVWAEDLSVHKNVLDDVIRHGDIETWVIRIEASEYRSFDDVIVADTLPDGVCPLSLAINHDAPDPECATAGVGPTVQVTPFGGPPGPVRDIDYTTVTENAIGTWSITFDPTIDGSLVELASVAPSSLITITVPTRTRTHFQDASADDTPVVAGDSWENEVDIEGTSLVPAIDTDQTDPIQVEDESEAGQYAPLPVIEKLVADPALFAPGPLPTPCPVPAATPLPLPSPWGAYVDGPTASYGPGDVACWLVRVDFPSNLDTAGAKVTDFVPQGHTYVGNYQIGATSVAVDTFSQDGGSLTWILGSSGDVGESEVFWATFATEVTDPLAATSVDISGNLMKFQSNNTVGAVAPQRDQADAEWAEAEVGLTKGVKSVNGGPPINGPNVDGEVVFGGDTVLYRIDISNVGDRDASAIEVWDILPAQLTCSDVSLAPPVSCNPAEDRIEWSGLAIPAGGSIELNYEVTVPAVMAPNESLDNTAGVRSYQSATNNGGPFTYYPESNIDPTLAPLENTDETSDSSSVVTTAIAPAKTRSTSVSEVGNTNEEATIGEIIDYEVTVSLPALLSMDSLQFQDALGTRQDLVPGSLVATLNDPLPGGTDIITSPNWSVSTLGNTIALTYLPPTWVGDADGTIMTVQFSASVNDTNSAGDSIENTATLAWVDQDSNPDSVDSNEVSTEIVEPDLTVDKTVDGLDSTDGQPGDGFLYSITVTNDGSSAHDVVVADVPDSELTGVVLVGGAADATDTWSPADPDIVWEPASIPSGGSVTYTYTAVLIASAGLSAGDQADNTVEITEYFGRPSAERAANPTHDYASYSGPSDDATVDLHFPEASLVKAAVGPTPARVGVAFEWSIDVENTSTVADIGLLNIEDVLPASWDYDTGSSELDGSGIADPTIVLDPGGDTLTWAIGPGLAAAASTTLTFTASPTAAAQVDAGLGVDHVNSASADFTDESGATGNADGAYEADADTAVAQLATGSIGDMVWFDIDANGASDGDDYAVAGALVELTWAGPDGDLATTADNVTYTQFTTGSGSYLFTDLPEGTFSAVVDPASLPGGFLPSYDLDDGATSPDGAWEGTLGSGAASLNVDFGYTGAGSLGDTVWFDLDGNGLADAGEPTLEGVEVTLTLPGPDGVVGGGDDVTVTEVTDATGSYSFDGLYDAEVNVAVTSGVPADMTVTYDLDDGTISPDGTWQGTFDSATSPDLDVDFGFSGSAMLGDVVWLDLDGDGTQDPGEPGLGGVTVELNWPGEDGIGGNADDEIITGVTAVDGSYGFTGLPAGSYDVSVVLPLGEFIPTADADLVADGMTTVVLAPAETNDAIDFGFEGTSSLSGEVVIDPDGDGVIPPGGDGIGGVEITITWDGPAGPIEFVVVTDPSGSWNVASLPPGAYTIAVNESSLPDGYGLTTPATTTATLLPGEDATVVTGAVELTSVTGTLWLDENGNGLVEPGEVPPPGITVFLVDAAGMVVATTTSAPDGTFVFEGVVPGPYTVVVQPGLLPSELTLTGPSSFSIVAGAAMAPITFSLEPETLPATGLGALYIGILGLLVVALGLGVVAVARRRGLPSDF